MNTCFHCKNWSPVYRTIEGSSIIDNCDLGECRGEPLNIRGKKINLNHLFTHRQTTCDSWEMEVEDDM